MTGTGHEFVATFGRMTGERGGHPAIVFLKDLDPGTAPDSRGPSLSYAELGLRARRMAAGLVAAGLRGERVLLLHPAGLEFAVAMLGCLFAGAVAVPAPPPTSFSRGVARLNGIVEDAGTAAVLADLSIAEQVRAWLGESGRAGRVRCLTEAEVEAIAPLSTDELATTAAPGGTAFLQYTSGSTSEPKGVVVSHRALGHNLRQIGRVIGLEPESRAVSWLPHFHDMGLVGQLLTTLYHGATVYLMSPTAFLKRPHRWMAMVSEQRATMTVGPDFAYDLAARRTTDEHLATLDLSTLRVALNGSEPLHEATMDRFAKRFAPAGLRPEALMPCYGMAETTLMVSATPAGTGRVARDVDAGELGRNRLAAAGEGQRATTVVSSGSPVELDVRIVDPDTHTELPEGRIGEIWVAGDSLADGYWRQPEATAAAFGARLTGGDSAYLRTGDLGALAEGELFVTGRIKEMLVLNGRNLYPQDLERSVRTAHGAVAAGVTAVFAAPYGDAVEQAVAVQEVRPGDLRSVDAAELLEAVRRRVWLDHEVRLGDVVLVPQGSVPRTTSGKIQRGQVRAAFLDGDLPVLARAGKPA